MTKTALIVLLHAIGIGTFWGVMRVRLQDIVEKEVKRRQ